MTPAEKIAELRLTFADECDRFRQRPRLGDRWFIDWRDITALLDIAEAAVARVAYGHDECCELCDLPGCDLPCTCGHDNLAAKLAALGGG